MLFSQGGVHREGERGGEEVEKPVPKRHLDGGRRSACAGGGDGAHLRIPGRDRRQRREEGKRKSASKVLVSFFLTACVPYEVCHVGGSCLASSARVVCVHRTRDGDHGCVVRSSVEVHSVPPLARDLGILRVN